MSQIVFAWIEGDTKVSRSFDIDTATIEPGKILIGRDPDQCDVVLPSITERDRTVSRCHAEVTLNEAQFGFYLRNLKSNNPIFINGQVAGAEPQRLTASTTIRMGEVELAVEAVAAVPETVIIPPPGQQPTILSTPSSAEAAKATPTPRVSANMPATNSFASAAATPTPDLPVNLPPAVPPPSGAIGVNDLSSISAQEPVNSNATSETPADSSTPLASAEGSGGSSGSILDRVKDHLFSCPNGHQYTLDEAKELGWICKYDGYLITSTFVAN